jgi:hypothetical protein
MNVEGFNNTNGGHLAQSAHFEGSFAFSSDGVHHLEPDVVSGFLIF